VVTKRRRITLPLDLLASVTACRPEPSESSQPSSRHPAEHPEQKCLPRRLPCSLNLRTTRLSPGQAIGDNPLTGGSVRLLRLCLRQAEDRVSLLPPSSLLQQLDAVVPSKDVFLRSYFPSRAKTWVLRHDITLLGPGYPFDMINRMKKTAASERRLIPLIAGKVFSPTTQPPSLGAYFPRRSHSATGHLG